MKKQLLSLLPLLGMFMPAWATVNPSTGDNNIVGIALVVGGIALVLVIVMMLTGKKKK